MTGEFIDAPTALAWGLVNRVAPPGELDAASRRWRASLIAKPRDVVAAGKTFFYEQLEEHARRGVRAAPASIITQNMLGERAQEGVERLRRQAAAALERMTRQPKDGRLRRAARIAACAVLASCAGAAHAVDIDVVGLYAGKAVVRIGNGVPKTLAVGQVTPEGVRLLRATSSEAEFEVDGKRQVLGLGRGRFGGADATAHASTTLYADARGHFVSEGAINGVAVRFLVDTGATAVGMSSRDAARIGLDYRNGQRLTVSTANGVVEARGVKLDRLQIGGITLTNVDAVVHEGDSPAIVLVGMSVLNRLEMRREGGLMTLTQRY